MKSATRAATRRVSIDLKCRAGPSTLAPASNRFHSSFAQAFTSSSHGQTTLNESERAYRETSRAKRSEHSPSKWSSRWNLPLRRTSSPFVTIRSASTASTSKGKAKAVTEADGIGSDEVLEEGSDLNPSEEGEGIDGSEGSNPVDLHDLPSTRPKGTRADDIILSKDETALWKSKIPALKIFRSKNLGQCIKVLMLAEKPISVRELSHIRTLAKYINAILEEQGSEITGKTLDSGGKGFYGVGLLDRLRSRNLQVTGLPSRFLQGGEAERFTKDSQSTFVARDFLLCLLDGTIRLEALHFKCKKHTFEIGEDVIFNGPYASIDDQYRSKYATRGIVIGHSETKRKGWAMTTYIVSDGRFKYVRQHLWRPSGNGLASHVVNAQVTERGSDVGGRGVDHDGETSVPT